jgi:hypothetical protein
VLGKGNELGDTASAAAIEGATAALRDEAVVMCQLYHPHVAKIYGIVLEYDDKKHVERLEVFGHVMKIAQNRGSSHYWLLQGSFCYLNSCLFTLSHPKLPLGLRSPLSEK